MSALQTLGLVLFAAVVVGYPLHRRAVRKEKAREAAAEGYFRAEERLREEIAQAFGVPVHHLLPHDALTQAFAEQPTVVESAEAMGRIDYELFDLLHDEGGAA